MTIEESGHVLDFDINFFDGLLQLQSSIDIF